MIHHHAMKNKSKNPGEEENEANIGLPNAVKGDAMNRLKDPNQSLASDGPVSQNEASDASDLNETQQKDSQHDTETGIGSN